MLRPRTAPARIDYNANKELSDIIAKPLRSNRQVMELSKRLDVLLEMKERANGAYCRAYD